MTLTYFGTDGIRGEAYQSPLTLEEATRWGAAWAQVARLRGVRRMVIGWDPRLSSEPLYHAFRTGVGMSLEVVRLGLAPTPAVAWTVAQYEEKGIPTWGLMISASHNPAPDNGLKGFNGKGEKLEEADERAIEEAFDALQEPTTILTDTMEGSLKPYLQHLGGIDLPADFKVVVDCAHGATGPCAKALLRGPGVSWIAREPQGAHINEGVGSTHLDKLQAEVKATGAHLGIAFDGDGDRCLAVDHHGDLLDGDQLLWLLVQDRIAAGDAPAGVVGTLMTNGGLAQALSEAGIPFVRTAVGDKFLLREMGQRGWDLAAEASGHLIQKRVGPSGDGLAAALAVLQALLHRPEAERFNWTFRPWPQRLVNVKARDRRPVEECAQLQAAMGTIGDRWGKGTRLVIRWSGTEPKLRLMVEAQEQAWVDQSLTELETAARADLGL
jgi:phosphoglucosamine mutase